MIESRSDVIESRAGVNDSRSGMIDSRSGMIDAASDVRAVARRANPTLDPPQRRPAKRSVSGMRTPMRETRRVKSSVG